MIGLVLLAGGTSKRFIDSIINFLNEPRQKEIKSAEIEIIKNINSQIQEQMKINKVFLKIHKYMVWEYSVKIFSNFKDIISNVVFVLNPSTFENHKKIIEEKMEEYGFKNVEFVEGGSKRQDSVFNGIKILEDKYIDYIIIHDLARPYIKNNDVKVLLDSIEDYDGLTLYSVPNDSVAANYENKVTYIPREKIYLVKTPQIFKKKAIINSHEELRRENLDLEFTDDISLLDFYMFKIGFIKGNPLNIKITTIEDYIVLHKIIEKEKTE
ncbi:MAG: 2-C-methyl-D-erythritol 4-phosphate cytidylyltransferase [Candidatus Calescibacterium sp.]|nr:2-C-methyl-D-erythritol 4-phosphate cytidylyltransferase [Candidatus Calescibacterium sp.]MCX7972511.1 2-C-methyl-D-erythritol 4-phosphate cytidylyltransferase [bacterium]MDW8195596.1 2-C-methyl-D-erythritol 4-phosphate cytidylyltransferase [Candidatus Calescibacterium sp.]